MKDAIQKHISAPDIRKSAYYLELYMGSWLSAAQEVRLIGEDPIEESRCARALTLQNRTINVIEEMEQGGEAILDKARSQGRIVELPDPSTPVGAKYDFKDLDSHRCLVQYMMLRIAMNRVLWSINMFLQGDQATHLNTEHERFCREIWKCLPYNKQVTLMVAMQFGDPFHLAYEGAHGAVKEYLLDYQMGVCSYRKRLPNDRKKVDDYMYTTALALTGRATIQERQDFPYWQHRAEVMV